MEPTKEAEAGASSGEAVLGRWCRSTRGGFRRIWTRWCGRRSSRRSTGCWRPKPTICAEPRRYERSPERLDTRAGIYDRQLQTKAGEVKLTGAAAAELAV